MLLRTIFVSWVTTALSIGCAAAQDAHAAQPTPDSAKPLSADSTPDQILDALDRRGRDLKSLTADVKMLEVDQAMGDETTRSGHVWLDNRDDAKTRFRATFDRKEQNGNVTDEKIEYVLDGGKLIDRNYKKTTQVTRTVLRPGEKMNLLKLGEGPFPLPIGQKKEDVHAQFEVKELEPKKDDPPDCVKIELVPKPGTSLARKLKLIDVFVNTHDELPQRIETLDASESTMRTTDLKNLKLNASISDADFALPRIDEKDWHLVDEAFQGDAAPPSPGGR
jgi:outer membrane lipoprotein-sorting protein